MQKFSAKLNELYLQYPAMTKLDQDPAGFKWMSCLDADHSIVSFIRSDGRPENTLLFVCNFTPIVYEKFMQGVPFAGTYKEILNSDSTTYGGQGNINPKEKRSVPQPCDGQDNSITIKLPPLGCAIFTCTPEAKAAKKETAENKASGKTKGTKKEKKTAE